MRFEKSEEIAQINFQREGQRSKYGCSERNQGSGPAGCLNYARVLGRAVFGQTWNDAMWPFRGEVFPRRGAWLRRLHANENVRVITRAASRHQGLQLIRNLARVPGDSAVNHSGSYTASGPLCRIHSLWSQGRALPPPSHFIRPAFINNRRFLDSIIDGFALTVQSEETDWESRYICPTCIRMDFFLSSVCT